MAKTNQLSPQNQFPQEPIKQSAQKQPDPYVGASAATLVFQLAHSADAIPQWGVNVVARDKALREFWPTESYLAGAIGNVCTRNSTFDWEIKGPSQKVIEAVKDMLLTALGRDMVGWDSFVLAHSQDLYTQDNGTMIELIRDPGMDANSKFKGPMAPVIGLAHLDSAQCVRTGNLQYPIIYTDRDSRQHKLAWYEVIAFSDLPSSSEKMNGVGYSAVSRALRLAQIMRSIAIFKDEEVSGRNIKRVNLVGGVSNTQIQDAVARTTEKADNAGFMRYVEHAVLASLDPERPVSVAELNLASLPENFNYDEEMQWYIAGLALDLGVDYQEFAPLPGGQLGSAEQSVMLNKKSSGKGPRSWMDRISNSFKYYGVLPRGYTLEFNDKNEQEELERQEVRTKAMEELAIAVNSKIMPGRSAAKSLVRRGIITQEEFDDIPEDFWKMTEEKPQEKLQPVGSRGGNTIAEDARRNDTSRPEPKSGGRLRKEAVDQQATMFEKALDTIKYIMPFMNKREKSQPVNVLVKNQQPSPPNVVVNNEQPENNITVNLPEQKAPVSKTYVRMPETKETILKAPDVHVNVEKQERPVVNVKVQPADVKIPRIKRDVQTVVRGKDKNIKETITTHEYED